MSATYLHYIYDPFCGWCYAAAPLVEAAAKLLPVVLHGGGMMTDTRRQFGSPAFREYVIPHVRRMSQLTGQKFDPAYTDHLLCDPSAVWDSAPPTAAILAAEELAGAGLEMLRRQQQAQYIEGRCIAEPKTLFEFAKDIGLNSGAFEASFTRMSGEPLQLHFDATSQLLSRVGGRGYPTFVLARPGRQQMIEASTYYGRVDGWTSQLSRWLSGLG